MNELRELLLEVALEILREEETPLALRKVAERAGKSRTAPYLVFGEQQDGGGLIGLKLAVATRGAEMLHSALLKEITSVKDARVALKGATNAFFTFVSANRRLFRLMFGPEVAEVSGSSTNDGELMIKHPEFKKLFSAREALEDVLFELIERLQQAGHVKDSDLSDIAMRAWMSLQGTASIMLDPVFSRFSSDLETTDDYADLAIRIILDESTTTNRLK